MRATIATIAAALAIYLPFEWDPADYTPEQTLLTGCEIAQDRAALTPLFPPAQVDALLADLAVVCNQSKE